MNLRKYSVVFLYYSKKEFFGGPFILKEIEEVKQRMSIHEYEIRKIYVCIYGLQFTM